MSKRNSKQGKARERRKAGRRNLSKRNAWANDLDPDRSKKRVGLRLGGAPLGDALAKAKEDAT